MAMNSSIMFSTTSETAPKFVSGLKSDTTGATVLFTCRAYLDIRVNSSSLERIEKKKEISFLGVQYLLVRIRYLLEVTVYVVVSHHN